MHDILHPIPTRRGTALLYGEHPLVIDPMLATFVGLHEAIILQQLHYWLRYNQKERNNIRDGRVWVYMSYQEWREQIPFFSCDQIKRAFLSLEKRKVVISRQFDRKDWNQRKWYSIDYLVLDDVQPLDFSDGAILHDRACAAAPSRVRNRTIEGATAHEQNQITETKAEINSEIKKRQAAKEINHPHQATTLEVGNSDHVQSVDIKKLLSQLPWMHGNQKINTPLDIEERKRTLHQQAAQLGLGTQ
ncbi:hypothetical protein [Geobacter sp.]|uniref:hypothetical protein n=1 Tax=Geobacter sp. TaxID=46610 RepID=UPI001ACD4EFE|nr:hypothetical protein [Geobacter sp.]CAG0941878.1 hypothetical protein ANRL1_00730 [Anaerolineae bacterium]